MAALWTAEDAKLVLNTEHIRIGRIKEMCGAAISPQVRFEDFESNFRWIIVTDWTVVDRNYRTLKLRIARGNGTVKVCSKRGEAAFSRNVIAENRDFSERCADIGAAYCSDCRLDRNLVPFRQPSARASPLFFIGLSSLCKPMFLGVEFCDQAPPTIAAFKSQFHNNAERSSLDECPWLPP